MTGGAATGQGAVKISDEWIAKLSGGYEVEQKESQEKVAFLKRANGARGTVHDCFLAIVKKSTIWNEFVKNHRSALDKSTWKQVQQVKISYDCVV